MGIGITGQYYISFGIGDYTDFIREEDLMEFTLVEETGNFLPTFRLSFESSDESLLGILNESNELTVSFGVDQRNTHETGLMIHNLQSMRTGPDRRWFGVKGTLFQTTYILNPHAYISEKVSGIEAIKEVVNTNNYFSWDSNIDKDASYDMMRWVQPNIPDREFVNNIWLHSYLPDSFIGLGISTFSSGVTLGNNTDRLPSRGSLIVRDVMKQLKTKDVWRLTQSPQSDFDIPYNTDYTIEVNTGEINQKIGYGRKLMALSLEDGDDAVFSEDARPIIANVSDLMRTQNIWMSWGGSVIQNENVHSNYWQARLKNLTNLSVLSTVKVTVTVPYRFINIKVWDVVLFKDIGIDGKGGVAGFHSGRYVVGKVIRTIARRDFVLRLELYRDALNDTVGDFIEAQDSTNGDSFGVNDDSTARSEEQRLTAVDEVLVDHPNLSIEEVSNIWIAAKESVFAAGWDQAENDLFYEKISTNMKSRVEAIINAVQ